MVEVLGLEIYSTAMVAVTVFGNLLPLGIIGALVWYGNRPKGVPAAWTSPTPVPVRTQRANRHTHAA
jgi:hypothetical protein